MPTYADASGNAHELAHAVLTGTRLRQPPYVSSELPTAMETFRAVGDLRCLVRCLFLLEERRPSDAVQRFQETWEVALAADDTAHQRRALDGLVAAHWSAGDRAAAARAYGALVELAGDEALARVPPGLLADLDRWATSVAEGRAHVRARRGSTLG